MMRRPLWTYRPLPCLLGLHATTRRRAAGPIKVGDLHHMGYRLIAECQRLGCAYVREILPVTEVINARNSVTSTGQENDVTTVDQWAERICLHAHETGADVIVVARNYGGGMAVSMLRATWESLIANGKLPSTAVLPTIQETTARRAGL